MALMLTFPNCKINIGLYVTSRREDGYHNIETVFYPVQLRDALEVVPAKGKTSIYMTGKAVSGAEEDNLVWRAYQLVAAKYPDKVEPLEIYLHKVIPMGAGLGGGSADGVFMLRLLNNYFKVEISEKELIAMSLELGSDCPFFIKNTPQFATGRGEQMEPSQVNLSPYSIQLVCPEVHISTGRAFQMLTPKEASFDLRKLPEIAVKDWKEQVSNDFEEPVFKGHPGLKDIKDQLYNQGALYASMSGSGSAIYGIFPKGQRAAINTELAIEEHFI